MLCWAYVWWSTIWDASLGFPGEGPAWSSLRTSSSHAMKWQSTAGTISSTVQFQAGMNVEHVFISRARSILAGASLGKGPASEIKAGISNEQIERILTRLAEDGNSKRPVGARFQSHPANVRRLVGDADSLAAESARRGVAYSFDSRPQQWRRPRPLHLAFDQELAASAEIARLFNVCQAIERAPSHDGDKCLRSWAKAYEREVLPRGRWPREPIIPLCKSDSEVEKYNLEQMRVYRKRRAAGLPLRDFESGVFTVTKSDGGYRLCTDYRELNKFAEKSKFQMEGVKEVAELIQPQDFGMLVDLKDAYLTLGLHPSHRKYCRFRCPQSKVRYQWKTVSFGTSEAPKLCTKIIRPLIKILKSLGIRCIIYIDDLLLLDQDPVRLGKAMAIAMDLLQKQVGLQLKLSKGNLLPSQLFTCLGIIWDTNKMTCHIPAKRIKALQGNARRILKMSSADAPIPTRDLARFVGQVVSTSRAIRPAKRRLLYIQHALSKAVRRGGWNGKCSISAAARKALLWWTTQEPWDANGNDIVPPVRPIQISLRTDAATHNAGYGGVMTLGSKTYETRGFLTKEEQDEVYINQYEFMGFANTLWALLPVAVPDRSKWSQVHVSVELDNVTAIKYGRVAVSRSIRMSLLGAKFFDRVEDSGISLTFRHLAGELNVAADGLSRQAHTHADWKLNRQLFRKIGLCLGGIPDVDLFASSQNRQTDTFYSYNHDHRAIGADSFLHSWSSWSLPYAYPPPILIGRVLQKLRADCCLRSIVIVPVWQAQTWFPTLLHMMKTPPLLLPNESWLVTDPLGKQAWPCRWPLIACDLSGSMAAAAASRKKYMRSVGRIPRTDIQYDMTSILRTSGNGGTVPTQLLSSVLQIFLQDGLQAT